MAGTIIGTPNSPPTVDADWDKVISNYVVAGKGQRSIGLTEWTTASAVKPAVESGSTIEVNGSFATFTATTIGDDGSLVTGTIYLYIDVTTTPGTPIPTFTNTAPTWDAAKGGYYNVAGDRYTGHQMEWDGSTAYTEKGLAANCEGGLTLVVGPDGGLLADNVFIKQKLIVSTIGGTGANNYAHGLAIADIISVTGMYYNSADSKWYVLDNRWTSSTSFLYTQVDATNVIINYNNITGISSQVVRILITYKEG